MRVAVVSLVVLATLVVAATAQSECAWEGLTCQNGGAFDIGSCEEAVECSLSAPPNTMNWVNEHRCRCPSEWTGADCSLVAPPPKMGAPTPVCAAENKQWDPSFIPRGTQQSKYLECYVEYTADTQQTNLREHMVNMTVTVDPSAPQTYAILFDLTSRHVNSSTSPLCNPREHDLRCELTQCEGNFDGRLVSYKCTALTCTSCANEPDSDCSEEFGGLAQALAPPVSFFFGHLTYNATALLKVTSAAATVSLDCQAGACL